MNSSRLTSLVRIVHPPHPRQHLTSPRSSHYSTYLPALIHTLPPAVRISRGLPLRRHPTCPPSSLSRQQGESRDVDTRSNHSIPPLALLQLHKGTNRVPIPTFLLLLFPITTRQLDTIATTSCFAFTSLDFRLFLAGPPSSHSPNPHALLLHSAPAVAPSLSQPRPTQAEFKPTESNKFSHKSSILLSRCYFLKIGLATSVSSSPYLVLSSKPPLLWLSSSSSSSQAARHLILPVIRRQLPSVSSIGHAHLQYPPWQIPLYCVFLACKTTGAALRNL